MSDSRGLPHQDYKQMEWKSSLENYTFEIASHKTSILQEQLKRLTYGAWHQ